MSDGEATSFSQLAVLGLETCREWSFERIHGQPEQVRGDLHAGWHLNQRPSQQDRRCHAAILAEHSRRPDRAVFERPPHLGSDAGGMATAVSHR